MNDKTMSNEIFEAIYKRCRAYDPFTHMIDSYRQEVSAEEANERVMISINNILKEFGIEMDSIPYKVDRSTPEKEARDSLRKWLTDHNIHLESETKEKRIWTEEEIKNYIQTNDKVLYNGLKKLYECQTADEQAEGRTSHANGKGFNGVDGPFLSSLSEFLLKKGYLTAKQKASARKLLVKYTKQLTDLANC